MTTTAGMIVIAGLAMSVSACSPRSPSSPTAPAKATATEATPTTTATPGIRPLGVTIGYEQAGGDAAGSRIESELRDDYRIAQQPFEGVGPWFYRTAYDSVGTSLEYALSIHRQEWRKTLDDKRAALGLPKVNWPTEGPAQ